MNQEQAAEEIAIKTEQIRALVAECRELSEKFVVDFDLREVLGIEYPEPNWDSSSIGC